LGKFEPGASLIAVKSGVPMIPTGIIGANQIFHNGGTFPRIEIHFAQPVSTIPSACSENKKSLEEIGKDVRLSIEKILN
jgi:1-acyl-sn-glycerol-3-phosphate acyltransferase